MNALGTLDYIINDIDPFLVTSEIGEIQNHFNQLTYSHVPVIDAEGYVGCISGTDAHCFESEKTLQEYRYSIEHFHVKKHTHWLDILEAFALHNTNIMPVLDDDQTYLGYYELNDIIGLFNDTPFLSETGGIVVIEKGMRDYSFSEICQIVESNEGKILAVFISKIENDVMQATIKLGHAGINEIVQTFRRYNYNVVSNHDEDTFIEDLKDRSKYLDKYLNI